MSTPHDRDLCGRCGACCDGTLFDYVPFRDDVHDHVVALGLVVAERDPGRPGFLQPCPQLRDGSCACYPTRPQSCAEFRCALLDGYATGARTLEECLATVAELRARVARAESSLGLPAGGLSADVLYERVRRREPLTDDDAIVQYLAFAARHFQAPAEDLESLRALVSPR